MMVSIISMTFVMKKNNVLFSMIVYSFYIFYWFMVVVVANLGQTYPYSSNLLDSML